MVVPCLCPPDANSGGRSGPAIENRNLSNTCLKINKKNAMHHLSRFGEGLTSGLNRIASTTQEFASSTSNLAMQLMDPAVAAAAESQAIHYQAAGEFCANSGDAAARDGQPDFKSISESIIKVIEDEILELQREKDEYQETLRKLKETQRKQDEAFSKAESLLSQRWEF
jgi:hypothetical protein